MATLRHRYQPPKAASSGDDTLPLDTLCTILTRQSTTAQKERNAFSAEVDPQDLIREAERLGFLPERIRVLDWDMGKGAYNTTIEDRPALHYWLTELLPSGQSLVVLVSQEDRLFRDKWEDQHNAFIRQVATHGGWVVCGVRGVRVYNFRREMDQEQFRLACKYGRQYIEFHIKGRLHPATQRAAMQGRYVGGMVPWGYTVDYAPYSTTYKHLLGYLPHATLIAEQVFTRFARLERPTVSEVARAWLRAGLVWPFFGPEVDGRQVRWHDSKCQRDIGRGGYAFEPRQAQTILTNPVYLGWMVRRGEVAWDAVTNQPARCHEPLVDPDLFWWCYDHILPTRPPFAPPRTGVVVAPYHARRSFTAPPNHVPFLAQGLIRCAQHGRRLAPFVERDDTRGTVGRTYVRCWQTNADQRIKLGDSLVECPVTPAEVLDEALCHSFVDNLRLEEPDVEALTQALAQAAQQREQGGADAAAIAAAAVERQIVEQQAAYARAKRLALAAPDLAADVVEEMRQAKRALADLEARLQDVRAAVVPTVRAWQLAERAVSLLDRIRATFQDWSRPAQTRVLGLALETAVLGRVDQRTLGLWLRWQGGGESRVRLARPNGRRREWTAEEDAALRAYFATLTQNALCAMLPGRALSAVRFRAYQLGLRRPKGGPFSALVPVVVPAPPTPNEMGTYGFSSGDAPGSVRDLSSDDASAAAA